MFWLKRRSILYFASLRFVIASSLQSWILRRRALLCAGHSPEPTGPVLKAWKGWTTGREAHRGPKPAREQPGSRQKPLLCQRKRPALWSKTLETTVGDLCWSARRE